MKSKFLPLYLLLITASLSTPSILGADDKDKGFLISFKPPQADYQFKSDSNFQYHNNDNCYYVFIKEAQVNEAKKKLSIDKPYKELSTPEVKKILEKICYSLGRRYKCNCIYKSKEETNTFRDDEKPFEEHATYIQQCYFEIKKADRNRPLENSIEKTQQEINNIKGSDGNNVLKDDDKETIKKLKAEIQRLQKELSKPHKTASWKDFDDYVNGNGFPTRTTQVGNKKEDYPLYVSFTPYRWHHRENEIKIAIIFILLIVGCCIVYNKLKSLKRNNKKTKKTAAKEKKNQPLIRN